MSKQILKVRILSPQKLIFQGEAISVSSTNSQGKFDILPQHANFITMVKDMPIIIMPITNKQRPLIYKFPLAIIYNFSNLVNIYTGI